jgi:TonB family protein
MSKTFLISSLAAVCWLAHAAVAQTAPMEPYNAPMQLIKDAPGVTVSMNGAAVLHRPGVSYPFAALQQGIQGTVSVQVKLDSTGIVNDAQVLSGPDELRKAVLESVLQWHFTRDVAGTTRVIGIAFEAPKASAGAAPAPAAFRQMQTFTTSGGIQPLQGHIKSIRVSGLSEQAGTELLASLPVHEGDEWNADAMQKMNLAVKAFDEHLTVQMTGMLQTPSGTTEMSLLITVPAAQAGAPATAAVPGRIKVGGNVQGAMIVSKVPPVYPALAKQAAVSGVVQLSAVLAKDGTVQELHVLSGPPLLIQAAMDAVKQWVYRPTLLNGNPVEVETTIDINFTLNQ